MKHLLITLIFAITAAFADNCEELYYAFVDVTFEQTVTICRVSGIEQGKTNILGFFFKMYDQNYQWTGQGQIKQAVLIYGPNRDAMLYYDQDPMVTQAKCINNNEFRTVRTVMTPRQIASKLLSFKNCSEHFNKTYAPTATEWMYTN